MAVEISYYDARLDSLSKWRELEWFRWWFVQGVYNDTGNLHSNEFNILIFTYRNAVHLQTISNKNRATIVVVWTFSY